jgi:hypothetical protein
MAQIIDPVPSGDMKPLLCCYVNASSQIQIARITNIENWYFERVVFPGQRLVFEALPQAQLEIHTGMIAIEEQFSSSEPTEPSESVPNDRDSDRQKVLSIH